MKKFLILIGCAWAVLHACSPINEEHPDPEDIVQKAIEAAGGTGFHEAKIRFRFREYEYEGHLNHQQYQFKRIGYQEGDTIIDYLDNDSYWRTINGLSVMPHDTMAIKYAASVNSVFYFVLLPLKLSDTAVRLSYDGPDSLGARSYHRLKVTFDEEGGGEDFHDIFLFWFDQETYSMDFLAYQFFTEGGGIRFRKAKNIRAVRGLRFADYDNYEPKIIVENHSLLLRHFENGDLKLLSEINLEEISVQ